VSVLIIDRSGRRELVRFKRVLGENQTRVAGDPRELGERTANVSVFIIDVFLLSALSVDGLINYAS